MKTILRITGSFFEPFDCELINWPELNAGDLITLKIFEGRPYWLRIENRQFNPILNHCTLICRVDSAKISDFLAERKRRVAYVFWIQMLGLNRANKQSLPAGRSAWRTFLFLSLKIAILFELITVSGYKSVNLI
jgi:hypothetical protein